ncbi:MAG: ribbon-helix-helix domain-containing protein [Candidatus Bathyarchaeia archaeon]
MVFMSVTVLTRIDKRLGRELDDLVKRGLYVSKSDAIRDGIRRLVMETSLDRKIVNRTYQTLARAASVFIVQEFREVVTDLILYGSAARGEAERDSDVDLLVVVDDRLDSAEVYDLIPAIHDRLSDLELETGVVFSVNAYRGTELKSLIEKGSSLESEIAESGIQLYGGILNEIGGRKAPGEGP